MSAAKSCGDPPVGSKPTFTMLARSSADLKAGLLAIPYWVGGYDMSMASMARYVTVVAPLYPVVGVLLARAGPTGLAGLAGSGSVLMAVYAGRFAQGHWIM